MRNARFSISYCSFYFDTTIPFVLITLFIILASGSFTIFHILLM